MRKLKLAENEIEYKCTNCNITFKSFKKICQVKCPKCKSGGSLRIWNINSNTKI